MITCLVFGVILVSVTSGEDARRIPEENILGTGSCSSDDDCYWLYFDSLATCVLAEVPDIFTGGTKESYRCICDPDSNYQNSNGQCVEVQDAQLGDRCGDGRGECITRRAVCQEGICACKKGTVKKVRASGVVICRKKRRSAAIREIIVAVPASVSPAEEEASAAPTEEASATPTEEATATPTEETTAAPTEEATAAPTEEATAAPTEEARAAPTEEATAAPTEEATAAPTEEATAAPTEKATA